MATPRAEARYWDSDCFLGWLLGEADKVDGCRQVLAAAAEGRVMIYTSTLTIAEVLHLKGRPRIAADERQAVERFFDHRYIVPVPLVREIAELARDLVWDQGIAPKDAVHVASAISTRLELLNTFDHGLLGKNGLEVASRTLAIEKPAIEGELPL